MIADVLCLSSSVGFGQQGVTPWLEVSRPCSIHVKAPGVLHLLTLVDTSFNKYLNWPQNVISQLILQGSGGKAVLCFLLSLEKQQQLERLGSWCYNYLEKFFTELQR